MSKRILVDLVDDLDHVTTATVATRSFALDGTDYEIDLCDANADDLRETFDRWIRYARRVRPRRRRYISHGPPIDDPAAARKWAADNGFAVAPRGRLPHSIADAYLREARKAVSD